jgi:hypothetical protein
MMNPESGYSGGLADSDLDQLLAATSEELLAHIGAATDPTATLIVIIDGAAPAIPADGSATAASIRYADRTPAALAIGIRSNTRRLSRILNRGLDRTGVLDRDLEQTSPLVRGLGLHTARALASDLARAIAGDLDAAHNLVSVLIHALVYGLNDDVNALHYARTSARHLADDLARDLDLDTAAVRSRVSSIKDILTLECGRVRDLDRALGAQEVDASGADLSGVTIEDLDTLDGVT